MRSRFAPLFVLLVSTACWAAEQGFSASFRTYEGRVLSLGSRGGEGELDQLTVDLAIEGNSAETIELIVAPRPVLSQLGLRLEEGDLLRTRVLGESGVAVSVQYLQNLSQGKAVRLRTLHAIPLWDATGRWQGGSVRDCSRPHRRRYRGGRGPS